MRKKMIVTTIALLFGGVVCALAAKPSAEQLKKDADAMTKLLESREYTVQVGQAIPLTGGGVTVDCILKVDNDQVYSALPYFGGGYSTTGNDSFLRFTGPISDYKIEQGKKNAQIVTFTAAREQGGPIKFKLEVFYNGSTMISANGSNLQPMRYDGQTRASEKAQQ